MGPAGERPTPSAAPASQRADGSGWLRGPAWDTAVLAYGWVPFYLWAVLGLGLGRDGFGLAPLSRTAGSAALATATVVALAITYVHRHYTFLLVYGDRQTWAGRVGAYVWAPLAVIAAVALARASASVQLLGISPWLVVLFITGVWNVWHTLQQRYGIGRIYAAKLGARLDQQGRGRDRLDPAAHARRDRALLWSLALVTAAAVLVLRPASFAGHMRARQVLRTLAPLVQPPGGTVLLLVALAIGVFVSWRWVAAERRSGASLRELAPRWSFVASTVMLLAVFVVHGPIVGYLCFGTAHAIEYVGFVHHFGERKYGGAPQRNLAAALFGSIVRAPLPLAAMLGLFVLLRPWADEAVYAVYYTVTSLLHFLFDGWIWKVRRPEVRQPLLRAS
ncbi:MAG: hypothetical protein K1X88_08270 [Nannocystaceae bacterium]|nr:hypothetical protein [Nannocystaceae bacterium]